MGTIWSNWTLETQGIKVRRERKRRNKRKGKEKRENSGARNLKRVELNSHKTPAIDDQK